MTTLPLVGANTLLFVGLLLGVGAAVVQLLVVDVLAAPARAAVAMHAAQAARRGGVLLVLGAAVRLVATAVAMADGEPLATMLRLLALETAPGQATLLVALSGLGLAALGRRLAGGGLAALSVLAAIGLARSGHATELDPAWLWSSLDVLHALGASAWIGALALLLPTLRTTASPPGVLPAVLARFAPVALGGAALAVGTGLARSVRVLPSVAALWESRYGQLLLAKACGVAIIVWFGWRNHRRHRGRPVLDATASAALTADATRELLVATGVVLLSAWLSVTPPSD